jgi:hypothetical protein
MSVAAVYSNAQKIPFAPGDPAATLLNTAISQK